MQWNLKSKTTICLEFPRKISLNSEFCPIPNFVQFGILSNTIQNSAQKNKCTNSGSISGNEQTKMCLNKKFKQIHNVYKLRACRPPPQKMDILQGTEQGWGHENFGGKKKISERYTNHIVQRKKKATSCREHDHEFNSFCVWMKGRDGAGRLCVCVCICVCVCVAWVLRANFLLVCVCVCF